MISRKISRSWAPRLQNSRNRWAKKWGPTCDRDISNPRYTRPRYIGLTLYLVGRLMYRVYNNDYPLFQAMFVLNKNVHNHNTRQTDHYHIPSFKTRLGKTGLHYNGATIWNKTLKLGIPIETQEFTFAKYLKSSILCGKL